MDISCGAKGVKKCVFLPVIKTDYIEVNLSRDSVKVLLRSGAWNTAGCLLEDDVNFNSMEYILHLGHGSFNLFLQSVLLKHGHAVPPCGILAHLFDKVVRITAGDQCADVSSVLWWETDRSSHAGKG